MGTRQFVRKVGGEDGHERKIYKHGAGVAQKRSPAGRDDRFAGGGRAFASVPDGPRLRSVSAGGSGCSRSGGDGRVLFAGTPVRTGESGTGDVVQPWKVV